MFRNNGRALDADHRELLGVCGEHEVRLHHQVREPRHGGALPGEEAGRGEPHQTPVGEQAEPGQCNHQSGQSEISDEKKRHGAQIYYVLYFTSC